MIRFLTRKGTLSLQGTISGTFEETRPFDGDLHELVKGLRECPGYQIDGNHKHCGLRSKLVARLIDIIPWKDTGLCLQCWQSQRDGESWLRNPNTEGWRFSLYSLYGGHSPCGGYHRRARMAYTASKIDWT